MCGAVNACQEVDVAMGGREGAYDVDVAMVKGFVHHENMLD